MENRRNIRVKWGQNDKYCVPQFDEKCHNGRGRKTVSGRPKSTRNKI